MDIEKEARDRYSSGLADSEYRAMRYQKVHKYYAPPGGDQWPDDLAQRPGKLHLTTNLIRRFVDTEARLLSIKPRFVIPPSQTSDPTVGEDQERRGEATEKLFDRILDGSGFDQWSFTFNQVKSLYGIDFLKPFWNESTKLPDVEIIEQPQNLMIGWADSNFLDIDWAIYHYKISGLRAKMNYGLSKEDIVAYPDTSGPGPNAPSGDHEDPVDTMSFSNRLGRASTDYERKFVGVWDYWYLREDGMVMNATLVAGKLVEGPIEHPELPTIPYIPVENDHEPGSPDGHSTAELLIDIQMGMNRAISHYAQHVWTTTDPAYQLTGAEAPMTVPAGLVPVSGEIVAPGPNVRIEEIRSGVNNFPFDSLIATYWNMAHRITGLSEILFGSPPGAQTSARALQAQLDSSINALDPKRTRYFEGLRGLFSFWHFMLLKKNPEIDGIRVKEVIDGMNNWQVVAPEISPRDVIEHTQNVINKVNGKLVSLQTAMDEVGVNNPLEEIDRIMAERSNAHLFPGDAQAIAAVVATLQAIQQQQAQAAAAQGQNAQAAAQQDAQQAQPTLFEDQNQPATGAGSPPPEGAPAPIGGELRPIVRQNPAGQSLPMSEIRLPNQGF
jgi:hypothetical protein